MPNQPPAAVRAAIKRDKVEVPEDRLEAIRVVLRRARDADREVSDLEARLKAVKAEVLDLKQKTLPDIYDAAGIDNLGLPAEGNLPAYDCALKPYYHANIGAEWPTEQRQAAFAYLEGHEAGDLIKSLYIVAVPRGKLALAKKVAAALAKLKVEFTTKQDVPWNTLTAWLKEQVEKRNHTPDLDVLGATVGRVVNLKERKTNG